MLDPEYRRFVERVKQAASIEDVVMARVPGMRQAGALYKACCPFHDERTPSFVVTPARGTWHCFGACGEGGDVIRFLEKLDGLTFREAVEELARQNGIEIPRSSRAARQQSARELAALEALERAQRLYQRKLKSPQAAEAQRYLAGRDLRPETLEVFGVGFAPGGNVLVGAAREAGFSEQPLLDAGLARRRDDGRLQDFFYARITIPIRDSDGRTLGFGARLLPGVEGPKYVNSPDSPLFHKGRLIFGLDQAREAVRREKRILLMEGYTDVMACHQVGLRTAVAVLGTATTDEHGKLVRRSGAKQATLVFDGDAAGRKAVYRALQGLVAIEGLRIDVALPPEGLDPADVCQKDPDSLRRALERPTPWFDFLLEGVAGLERDQRPAAVRELLTVLRRLPSPVERENLIAAASQRLGLSQESLLAEGQRLERSGREPRAAAPADESRAPAPAAGTARPAQARRSGARAPAAGLPPGQREVRAWGELLAALLLDNALIEVRRSEVRLAFEGPVYEPLGPAGAAGQGGDNNRGALAGEPGGEAFPGDRAASPGLLAGQRAAASPAAAARDVGPAGAAASSAPFSAGAASGAGSASAGSSGPRVGAPEAGNPGGGDRLGASTGPSAPPEDPARRPPPPDAEGRWGAPDARLRLLFQTLLELYDDAAYADRSIDAGLLLGAVEDGPARELLTRLDAANQFAESPRALAEQVLDTLGKVWRRRREALLLARPLGTQGAESEEDVIRRLNQLVLERRQSLGRDAAKTGADRDRPAEARPAAASRTAPATAPPAALPERPRARPAAESRDAGARGPAAAESASEGLDWGDLGPL
jgi:DNA primase